jgi:CDP-glucose 4,6-dehydratase
MENMVIPNSVKELANVYRGKKVFLTGHTGFKGSWLLTWLHLLGAEIKGYALKPLPDQRLYNQVGGENMGESTYDDVLNYPILEKALLEFEPDFIFHLAAQPIVRASYALPVETLAINAMGTAHVLNIARSLKKACSIVLVTTDKVYHNQEWVYAYRESDHLGGYDPYSASKACAEIIINSYRNSYFNPETYEDHKKSIAVARAGNVIGGGDWAKDRIIPDCIRALQDEVSIPVRNPNAVRPWQHVIESLFAYLLLGKMLTKDPFRFATAYNFGPFMKDCLRVEDMVKQVVDIWGNGVYHVINETRKPHEAELLRLDINKAAAELNWTPVFSAREAIHLTVGWYKHFNGGNARELIRSDIDSFMAKLDT